MKKGKRLLALSLTLVMALSACTKPSEPKGVFVTFVTVFSFKDFVPPAFHYISMDSSIIIFIL